MAGGEFHTQGPHAVVWDGKKFATRRWKVWGGADQQTIVYRPQTVTLDDGSNLPARGSIWNGMFLDMYTATRIGPDLYDVVATYSTEAQRYKFRTSFQTETVNVPYCTRGTTILPASAGTSGAVAFAWELRNQPFLMSVSRAAFTVYPSFPGPRAPFEQTSAIIDRVNELHQPLSVDAWYRFEGADAEMVGSDEQTGGDDQAVTYQITYSWVHEAGLELPPGGLAGAEGSISTSVAFPESQASLLEGDSLTDYFLPPFHRFIPYRLAEDGADKPYRFKAVLPFRQFRDGWGTLPGMRP